MYCIKIPKKDIWRHRNHIQNYFFLEFNPENMPAVANVGFSYNWQGFIYLIQIIHWFKIQIGLLNGSPSKVGMLVTIEIFLPTPQSVSQKETPHPQSHKYISFNSADTTLKNVILLRCWFAVCVNKSFSW